MAYADAALSCHGVGVVVLADRAVPAVSLQALGVEPPLGLRLPGMWTEYTSLFLEPDTQVCT